MIGTASWIAVVCVISSLGAVRTFFCTPWSSRNQLPKIIMQDVAMITISIVIVGISRSPCTTYSKAWHSMAVRQMNAISCPTTTVSTSFLLRYHSCQAYTCLSSRCLPSTHGSNLLAKIVMKIKSEALSVMWLGGC